MHGDRAEGARSGPNRSPGTFAGELDAERMRRLLDLGAGLVEELDLETLLDRILAAARELTGASYAALGVLDESRMALKRFVVHGIDEQTRREIGDLPTGKGVLGFLIDVPRPLRLANVRSHPRAAGFPPGHPPMETFLGVPIVIRGRPYGNLYLTEKEGGREFDAADERAAVVLASWAAIAIDNAELIAQEKIRHSITAAERERKRWARELHDETLQSLGALRVLLASALRADSPEALEKASEETVERLSDEITGLRSLIAELRPAALDELGLRAALEGLVERHAAAGFEIRASIDLRYGGERTVRLDPEIELTVYRIVQEALTNVVKHSRAELVDLTVSESDSTIDVVLIDDGVGFTSTGRGPGFGLIGMRERVTLVAGHLEISAAPGRGTTVRLSVPIALAQAEDNGDEGRYPVSGPQAVSPSSSPRSSA